MNTKTHKKILFTKITMIIIVFLLAITIPIDIYIGNYLHAVTTCLWIYISISTYKMAIDTLEVKEVKKIEQKPAEWSEEDSAMVEDIVKNLKKYQLQMPNYRVELQMRWLKSLRSQNTYNPYKAVVESIAEMCKHYDGVSHIGLRDFYDNVKVKCKDAKEYDKMFPQAQWKPSEEQ